MKPLKFTTAWFRKHTFARNYNVLHIANLTLL